MYDKDRQTDRQTDRPALLREVRDESVKHEDDENGNEDVIDGAYVTDLEQLTTTTTTTTTYNYNSSVNQPQ